MRIEEMMSTHPRKQQMKAGITSTVRTIFECADACLTCADACLAEEQVQELVRCIRLNLDCAEICEVTGKILARQTEPDPELIRAQLQACIAACRSCAAECDRHAQMHEHCGICAVACRECEEVCMKMLEEFPSRQSSMI
jgi:hypothetical protein